MRPCSESIQSSFPSPPTASPILPYAFSTARTPKPPFFHKTSHSSYSSMVCACEIATIRLEVLIRPDRSWWSDTAVSAHDRLLCARLHCPSRGEERELIRPRYIFRTFSRSIYQDAARRNLPRKIGTHTPHPRSVHSLPISSSDTERKTKRWFLLDTRWAAQ
jgi:hypothetical protein